MDYIQEVGFLPLLDSGIRCLWVLALASVSFHSPSETLRGEASFILVNPL